MLHISPFPKLRGSGQKERKVLLKEELWHPTRATRSTKYHRGRQHNYPYHSPWPEAWQEGTDSFKGDGILLQTRSCHTRYLQSNVLFILDLRLAHRNCLTHKLLKPHRIWTRHSQASISDGHFYYRVCYLGSMERLVAKCIKSPVYPVFTCASSESCQTWLLIRRNAMLQFFVMFVVLL